MNFARFIRYLLLALVGIALVAWILLRQSLPRQEQATALAGLQSEATLRYDAWQRPYVEAAGLADALRVQGWLHATHRLWQMEMLRRAGRGRLAEMLGADLLETDKQLWRAGVPQLAGRLESHASPATLAAVDAYLEGVNAGIAGLRLLPPEFLLLGQARPSWQRRDVFALGALMAHQSANNLDNELLRLALAGVLEVDEMAAFLTDDSGRYEYPFVLDAGSDSVALGEALDAVALTDPGVNPLMPRLGFGSNGWVVGAGKSTSGLPLFAFDSHDELGLPNLFYEVHLFFGDNRQLRGWSVPGMPGVINGYNENIAWGFTNIGDTQDVFVETRSEQDPMLFRFGNTWRRARVETVDIPVRGGATERLEIVHTHNGPLVSETPALSLAWTVHRMPAPSLDSMLDFNLAGNWDEFNVALDAFPAPTLNATYADRHGTIGFRTAGVLPQRGRGQGLMPQDGSSPAAVWQGLVPPSAMPRRNNPPAGFLAAANSRVNPAGQGPLVSADNAAPYRIARIQQVLGKAESLSLEDMRALQIDWTDGQAQLLLPTLLAALPASKDPLLEAGIGLLTQWLEEPVAAPGSAAALLFQSWYVALSEEVFAQRLGELYPRLLRRAYLLNHALDHLLLYAPESPWWRGQRAGIIAAALHRAMTRIVEEQGPEPGAWRLNRQQHVRLRHSLGAVSPVLASLLDAGDAPWGGSVSTVGRARYSYASPFAVNSGATVRVVAEMGAVPSVQAVIPGGQSGHFLSEHYLDQYPHWLAGRLLPLASLPSSLDREAQRFLPASKAILRQ